MSKNNLVPRILENTQTLIKLYNNMKQSHKNKDENPEGWKEACSVFHSSYNQLAFPGGLLEGLNSLKKHDPHTIEIAIEYLKVDPYHFRSGYNKKQIIHLLKSVSLTKKQINILQEILINALKGKHVFYMEYCRLARKIQDPKFRAKIEDLTARSTNKYEINRAKKMLHSMNS